MTLHGAALEGRLAEVAGLIAAGADVNAVDPTSKTPMTPLSLAATVVPAEDGGGSASPTPSAPPAAAPRPPKPVFAPFPITLTLQRHQRVDVELSGRISNSPPQPGLDGGAPTPTFELQLRGVLVRAFGIECVHPIARAGTP